MDEIEEMGGMPKAIDKGIPKLRIEDAAAKKQALIENGENYIIGVNKFRTSSTYEFDVLEIDNTAVRNLQLDKLANLKANRDEEKVNSILNDLYNAAKNNTGNLLELTVEAARLRAMIKESEYDYYVKQKDKKTLEEYIKYLVWLQGFG